MYITYSNIFSYTFGDTTFSNILYSSYDTVIFTINSKNMKIDLKIELLQKLGYLLLLTICISIFVYRFSLCVERYNKQETSMQMELKK